MSINLPYVDEHTITIAAPRDQVWTALQRYVATSIGISGSSPLARILGTAPRSGFAVVEEVPGGRCQACAQVHPLRPAPRCHRGE